MTYSGIILDCTDRRTDRITDTDASIMSPKINCAAVCLLKQKHQLSNRSRSACPGCSNSIIKSSMHVTNRCQTFEIVSSERQNATAVR